MVKTTILVEKETREKLQKTGHKGQTYDQIIAELLLEHHSQNGKQQQK